MKFNVSKFFNQKIIASIIIVSFSAGIGLFLFGAADANKMVTQSNPKALIIDQLYDDIPNRYFSQRVGELLAGAGYSVEMVTTKDITVDYYKKLPTLDYKFIVIRTHGAVDSADQTTVTLFTGEEYSTEKYISEQLFGQVKKGVPMLERTFSTSVSESLRSIQNGTYKPITLSLTDTVARQGEYFAITPTFVDAAMNGEFAETIFVLGGCKTMHTDSLAKSLVKKGASSVVGWDNPVSSTDNDIAMLELLERLLTDKMEISEAMNSANELIDIEHMAYPARLKFYSEQV
jgi:hypothetical protein